MTQSRIKAGLANWPQLAGIAGLATEGWKAELLRSRCDPRGDRVVLALSHARHPPVVVKQAFTPADVAVTAKAIAAQTRAHALLADHPNARVPKVLAALPGLGALMMEQVPGLQLAERIETNQIEGPVTQTGRWLAAFHREGHRADHGTGALESRAFQPRFVMDHLTRAAANIRAGQRRIARAGRFAACIERLTKEARTIKGAATRAAPRHGDLNARNVLLSDQDDIVWGLDFSDPVVRPIGFDIARLLVSLAEFAPIPPGGPLVPERIRSAFLVGYDLAEPDDATIGFLCRARLLNNWLTLPHTEGEMTIPQTIRFQRILALAEAGILEEA